MGMEANMAVAFLDTRDELRHELGGAEDALAPARGIVIGLILSSALWTLLAFVAMHL